jgi:hypothetical protein
MAKLLSQVAEPQVSPELTEPRYIYNGQPAIESPDFIQRGNRPLKTRKRSPFNIIAVVALVSLLIVFYVWNKITVNRLTAEVEGLSIYKARLEKAKSELEMELTKKTAWENIETPAKKLGLIAPKDQPQWFEVKAGKPEKAQQ